MARQPKIDEKRQRADAKKSATKPKLGTKENPVGGPKGSGMSGGKYPRDPDSRGSRGHYAARTFGESTGSSSNLSESPRPKARPEYSPRPKARPEDAYVDLSPRAEAAERKEVTGKKYGGRMKKMAGGGSCRGMGKATRGGGYGKMG